MFVQAVLGTLRFIAYSVEIHQACICLQYAAFDQDHPFSDTSQEPTAASLCMSLYSSP